MDLPAESMVCVSLSSIQHCCLEYKQFIRSLLKIVILAHCEFRYHRKGKGGKDTLAHSLAT